MKLKGITIWEQHVEKIVLGVIGAAFLVFAGMQLIGNPHAVEIAGEEYTPRDVDDRVAEQATQIMSRLDPDAPPEVELVQALSPQESFQQAMASTLDERRLARTYASLSPEVEGVATEERPFVVPEVPVASQVLARQYEDALEESAVEDHEELASYLPGGDEPPDIMYTTVGLEYPIAELREELRRTDHEGERQSVPEAWYGGQAYFIDVVYERQRYEDGQWVESTRLEPIPGQSTYRPRLEAEDEDDAIDASARDDILTQLSDPSSQQAIVQPAFYATRNDAWIPPFSPVFDEMEQGEQRVQTRADRLQRQLRQLNMRLSRLEARMRELDIPFDPGSGGGGEAGGGGGEDGGGIGGMGGSQGGGGPDSGRADQMRDQRERMLEQIEDIESELEALGEEVEEFDDRTSFDVFEDDEVYMWAHDIDVEPGETYRYRAQVRIYNPFFARRLFLVEDQQHLADKFTLDSDFTEWSEPIQVRPRQVIYYVDARPPSEDEVTRIRDLGQVDAEVYRFYDGRWWMETFRIQPGDRIGLETQRRGRRDEGEDIDFKTDWYLVDCISDVDRETPLVMAQHLYTGELSGMLDPETQVRDPERQRLRQLVREARELDPDDDLARAR